MPILYSMVTETANRNRILEMCEFRIWFRLGITSTIFYRLSPNFASVSGMSHRRLFVTQTGSSLLILEVCGFFFGSFRALASTSFNRSAPDPMYRYNSAMPTLYSMMNGTGNRNRILERCKIQFWLVHWIDPRSLEHNYAC